MKVSLVGAELEENLGLRYSASWLESSGHRVEIVPFNTEQDIPGVVEQVIAFAPQLTGFSMVFTGRAREFCLLARTLRDGGYPGHLIAGGHFASLNCERLLRDFPQFDSVGLREGEELICALADHLKDDTGKLAKAELKDLIMTAKNDSEIFLREQGIKLDRYLNQLALSQITKEQFEGYMRDIQDLTEMQALKMSVTAKARAQRLVQGVTDLIINGLLVLI